MENNEQDIYEITLNLHKKLALCFFANSIAFRIVENPHFLDFVRALCEARINYQPPSRLVLADAILNLVHEDIVVKKQRLLDNTDCVLLIDGWTNKSINRKFLVYTLRNIHCSQVYLGFKDISIESENAVNLGINIQNAINTAYETYGAKVFSAITDNDAKIIAGVRNARSVNGRRLIQTTCASHSANLLLKRFVTADFERHVKEVLNFFSNPKYETLLTDYLHGYKLRNLPDTRFCYFRDTCQSILDNFEPLLEITLNIEDVNGRQTIRDILEDEEFENQLRYTIQHLDPICFIINQCQDPKTNVADSVQYWLTLNLPTQDYNDMIQQRIQNAIWPVGYAANLLHNNYRGLLLDDDQRRKALQFLSDHYCQNVINEFNNYTENMNRLQEFADENNPVTFWTITRFRYPNLASCALQLMLIPASTALIESLFSSWKYVHNIYRNRLKQERSSKLIDIYHFVKNFDVGDNELDAENNDVNIDGA